MKTALLATIAIGAAASTAFAVDLRIKSELGQSLEINDNRDLRIRPAGVTYAPVSNLMFDVLARTPTMRFEGNANLAYRTYFGPGAIGTSDALDKDARVKLVKTRPLTTYDIGTFWSQRDASTVQLEENARSTATGAIVTYGVEGGLQHQFSARDKFAFLARGSTVSFTSTSPTQKPYDDFTTNATWTHRATRTTDLIALVNGYFKQDASSTIEIWRATGGISSRLTPRMTFSGSAGPVFLKATGTNGSLTPDSTLLPSGGSAVSWVADAALSYRLRPTNRVSLFAGRNVSADSFGDVQLREFVGIYMTEEINRRSSLTLGSNLSRSTGGGTGSGSSETFDASATYGYRLTPELSSSIAYKFIQRMDRIGSARSNSILLSIRREVTILP